MALLGAVPRLPGRVAARRWALYPERRNPRLVEALATLHGLAPDEVAVGNGSGELIHAAVSVFAGNGGALVLAPPTFSLYKQMAAIDGARVTLTEAPWCSVFHHCTEK